MLCASILASATELAAQDTCHNEAINVTGPELTPLLDFPQACSMDGQPADGQIADGTFVRSWTALRQGARASLTGQCIVRYTQDSNCVTAYIQNRDINDVFLLFFDPTGDTPGINYPMTFMGKPPSKQTIDSDIPGTTNGPIGRTVVEEGTWQFRYWVLSGATQCQILRTAHPEKHVEVNVTECKPEWYVENGVNFHAPPAGDIRIVLPASGWELAVGPLQAAADEWSLRLGRKIVLDQVGACEAEGVSGILCVELVD
jgi:hypothetical protein